MTKPHPPSAQILPFREDRHENAVGVVIRWLEDRHRKAWHNASVSWLQSLQPERVQHPLEFDEEVVEMLSINASESLLAGGELFVKGEMRSVNAHVLGRDGPYLTPSQQHWIAQLGERPLRLYRVTEVRAGEGMTLVDELDDSAPPLVVRERSGSETARPGMLLGARVMHLAEHLELSGAIYAFAPLRERDVLGQVRATLESGLHPSNRRRLAELTIARRWLAQWTEPTPMPTMRDAATGDPILLVTDHYRVDDPVRLRESLASQEDVSGDPEQGWHRDVDAGGGMQRSVATINPGKAGRSGKRLEIFYRTQRLADEGRAWFDAIAGNAVTFLTREMTDPRSSSSIESTSRARSGPPPSLDPAVMTALFEQVLRKHYANWADEPIPLLGDRTPRETITTPAGLERVKGLLRKYESAEVDRAIVEGRAPVSHQFLWDSLGIARA